MDRVQLHKRDVFAEGRQERPDDLAVEFVATLKGEVHQNYKPARNGSIEFEYRWWLSDGSGLNSSWHEDDWQVLWDALSLLLQAEPASRAAVLKATSPPDPS